MVEVTDGTDEYNATHYRVSFFYDLAKAAVNRMAFALAHELKPYGATALSLTFVGRAVAALAATPVCRAGTGSRCPADSSRRSTGSPISTAADRSPGATSSRSGRGAAADATGYR